MTESHRDHRIARPDPARSARVVARHPLRYADGADPALDRPGHVRAGSGLARVPTGLAVIQDDAHFVALVDPASRRVDAVTLPFAVDGRRQFDDRRGNKAQKLDLEACATLPDDHGDPLLLALGSGSTPQREHAALLTGWNGAANAAAVCARVVHLPALYATLRAEAAFAGSELNVEGAAWLGDRLRLFGRGNGAARDDVAAVNATCDLDGAALRAHLRDPAGAPPPAPRDVVRYDLGTIDGIPLSFTDAAAWRGGILFAAAAEDSPDAVRDGRVAGSALGTIDAAGAVRWTLVLDADGRAFDGKVEGVLPMDGAADRLWIVVDVDDPDVPSELCEVVLEGDWG